MKKHEVHSKKRQTVIMNTGNKVYKELWSKI